MRTPICDVFGIEFPIFAFSHCRDVVAAVSRAGGFGVLGALAFSPEQLELELKWIDENIDGKPYGVDVVMPASYVGKEQGDLQKIDLEKMIPQEDRSREDDPAGGQKVPGGAAGGIRGSPAPR
jgi:NAD(P)H-dependent flavin oxidoreductase YrpB (nitropropane dioxygenase family)